MAATAALATRQTNFDPFGEEFRRDPLALFPRLLDASPGFIQMEGILSAYVAKQAQVAAVMRDFKRFSSVKPKGLPGMERVDFFNGQPVMNYSDPPTHDRLRRVVNICFLPKRVARIAEATARLIDQLLDNIRPGDTVDVVSAISKPLSYGMLMGEFLNVPAEDRPVFLRYLKSIPLLDQVRPGGSKPQEFLDAWAAGADWCKRALEKAKRERTDDLIGLIAAAEDGGTMSEDEMMAMMVVLFSGGISTVAGSVSASLMHIAHNPETADRVRADPALAAKVLEESIRLASPVTLVMRFATEDAEIGGQIIPSGMPLYVMLGAAGRDPATWPDPDRFNIERTNLREHVSFGYGIHSCIGSTITRATAPMAVRAVAQRFPKLRPAASGAGVTWETTPRSRHIASLPLTF